MSYLLDLVRTFSPDEMAQFRHLDVIGKEEMVRDIYANQAKGGTFNESRLPQQLQLTTSHFDKINSVLLDKTITALFGNDYGKALSTILNKGLSALMLHELKILEKKVNKQRDPKTERAFYHAAFENLRSMFHPNYNSKLTHQFGNKYLQALGTKKNIADESYVAMFTLYGDIVSASYGGAEKTFKPKAAKLLDAWEKKIAPYKNARATFYTEFARATYYKHFTEDAPGFLKANERALGALRKSKGAIDSKYEGIVLCELGFANIAINQFIKGQTYYADAFEKFADTVGKSTYQAGNYFGVTLLIKNYTEANRIFDKYLRPKIQPSTNRSVLFDIYIIVAWSHIQQQQFNEAFEYLSKLKQYRKNEITMLGHVMVRQLESAYFCLSGDIKTAAITIQKNIRFIQKQQGGSSIFEYYLQYTEVIDKLIKMERGKLRFPEKLKEQIDSLPGGLYQGCNMPLAEKFNLLSATAS